MRDAEWDYAHTDYTDYTGPAARPSPAGLADSEADWRSLHLDTPNGWLLRRNAMLETLTSGQPIHLMHVTTALDAIRSSGQLYASAGCLVGALYCAPLTQESGGLRPHNLGAYLLETKHDTRTMVIEITPDGPVPAKGLDYLRLGGIHLRTYLNHRAFLTDAEDAQLRRTAVKRVRAAAGFLDVVLATACGSSTPDAEFIDRLAAAVQDLPFLGYLYFEVLSEYLMLHSTAPQTKAYAEASGEMNNRLYKQLAFSAVASMGRLFDLALFGPNHDQLVHLVGQVESGLAPGAASYVRRRLPHLFACLALAPSQDAASVTFQGCDFDTLAAAAPGLLGQLLFREMRRLQRYPQLFPLFEQAKALEVYDYWNTHKIPTPFNGTLPKGEIGVNPASPAVASCTVWEAETCERGLLHPVQQLDVIFVPRLTDLRSTALGRAAFPRGG
ncbi:hypothetical protein AB0F88_16925 [Streptosporangium sp. NPDC023963]|uniref:hypothetical protein n=1 Tax=Streptosporangium sp. NPDC023963 TaxID=3155608 RepID=UPI0034494ED1